MRPKKAETAVHGCYQSGSLFFMVVSRDKARYQRGHSAQYSGFKLATCTFVLSILEFIFIATSNKHYAFVFAKKLVYFNLKLIITSNLVTFLEISLFLSQLRVNLNLSAIIGRENGITRIL